MEEFDVIVIGGGMIGLAFTLELSRKKNFKIAIIEAKECNPKVSSSFHTRVSAITPSSKDFLSSINVWDDIKRKQGFVATKVWDQNSHGSLNFYAKDEGIEHLGFIVENDLIQSALYKAIDQTKVQVIHAKLNDLIKTDFGYQITLDNDQSFLCKLVVGADGPKSKVRSLGGIEVSSNDYQQKAIIANIVSDKSLESTTWQRFLSDSIIALLPLSKNQA